VAGYQKSCRDHADHLL